MRWKALTAIIAIGVLLLQALVGVAPSKAALVTSGLVLNLDASVAGSYDGTTWVDQSGNGYNATQNNAPAFDPTDGSFTFNGINQYFNLGNVLGMSGPFSIEVTFNPNSVSGGPALVSRQNTGVRGNYFMGISNSKVNYYVESPPWGLNSSSTLSTGTKYVTTMVYDSAKAITPYLNGSQNGVKTTFSNSISAGAINLQIGAMLNQGSPSDFFSGKIYSVRIYNRALTSSEVSQNYAEATKIVLSNYGAAANCPWGGTQKYGTRFIAGTSATITKVRLQLEQQSPDSVINATQVDIHANNGGVIGTLIGTLRPTVLDSASTLPGAGVATRRIAYTGSVNVTSGSSYWISLNTNGQLTTMCGSGSFGVQTDGWSVERSSSDYYMRFGGGGSYTTYFQIFQFEMSLGAPDTVVPIITGPGSATTSSVSISTPENLSWSNTYAANEPVTWSISGLDASAFSLNQNGTLSLAAKNFEVPSDNNGDGAFTVTITATDGAGNATSQALALTISNANDFPTITTGSGAATYSISIAENQSSVVTYAGTDVDPSTTLRWNFYDGSNDRGKFAINSSTGALTFISPPDFENPTDTNRDNVYRAYISLSDGTATVFQQIYVTITNVNESSSIATPTIASSAFKGLLTNISVVADTPGKIRFFMDGRKIPACLSVTTTGSAPTATAVCSFKPAVLGIHLITARLTPTNVGLTPSISTQLKITVMKRTSLR